MFRLTFSLSLLTASSMHHHRTALMLFARIEQLGCPGIRYTQEIQHMNATAILRLIHFSKFMLVGLCAWMLLCAASISYAQPKLTPEQLKHIDYLSRVNQSPAALELFADAQKHHIDLTQDASALLKLYQQQAAQNDAKAQYMLGWIHKYGYLVEKDLAQYIHWTTLATQQNFAPAQFALGFAYLNGIGITPDLKLALHWISLAAEQGLALAQFNLGRLYALDDKKLAVHWLSLAVEQNHALSQSRLGLMYTFGDGVEVDLKKGLSLLELGAQQGDVMGQYLLGTIYEKGELATKNIEQARYWYEQAAQQGDKRSMAALCRLNNSAQ